MSSKDKFIWLINDLENHIKELLSSEKDSDKKEAEKLQKNIK